jgi:hypothetical protein
MSAELFAFQDSLGDDLLFGRQGGERFGLPVMLDRFVHPPGLATDSTIADQFVALDEPLWEPLFNSSAKTGECLAAKNAIQGRRAAKMSPKSEKLKQEKKAGLSVKRRKRNRFTPKFGFYSRNRLNSCPSKFSFYGWHFHCLTLAVVTR